jgi:sigma-B regulation protein RsbU (phosphoserine phosphatase)
MAAVMESVIREQLIDRKVRLESALMNVHGDEGLLGLLGQVDAALDRVEAGVYGLCEVCHDTVESDRLLADPLVKVCIGCMGPDERRALEDDLELAATIQRGLLPERNLQVDGWHASYHYQPALHVSGDYCDLITTPERQLYFILGDVSGKGVAASMLMAHLHAMFRTLISVGLPLKQLMERASRVFCESTLPTHYATLVCGRADDCLSACSATNSFPYKSFNSRPAMHCCFIRTA